MDSRKGAKDAKMFATDKHRWTRTLQVELELGALGGLARNLTEIQGTLKRGFSLSQRRKERKGVAMDKH